MPKLALGVQAVIPNSDRLLGCGHVAIFDQNRDKSQSSWQDSVRIGFADLRSKFGRFAKENEMAQEELREGDDYYINEDGFMVFTAAYLLKRGYCCENGCRHCPYGFSSNKDSDQS